jgi:hypothetical protein
MVPASLARRSSMKNRVKWLIIVAALMGAGGCAVQDKSPAARFARFDVDRDGSLSKVEFTKAAADWAFPYFDLDGDGLISLKEWQKIEGKQQDDAFRQMDLDKSGGVTVDEARKTAGAHPVFPSLWTQMDTDANGRIDSGEVKAYHEHRQRYVP